jgi:hypothetical protein
MSTRRVAHRLLLVAARLRVCAHRFAVGTHGVGLRALGITLRLLLVTLRFALGTLGLAMRVALSTFRRALRFTLRTLRFTLRLVSGGIFLVTRIRDSWTSEQRCTDQDAESQGTHEPSGFVDTRSRRAVDNKNDRDARVARCRALSRHGARMCRTG